MYMLSHVFKPHASLLKATHLLRETILLSVKNAPCTGITENV